MRLITSPRHSSVLQIVILIIFTILPVAIDAENLQWSAVHGSADLGLGNIYGQRGVPSPSNRPGTRLSGATWTDANGNLWLYGGYGFDATVPGYEYEATFDNMWKYDPITGNWTWMKGTSGNGEYTQPAVYGTAEELDPANTPGSQYDSSTWIDSQGKLWMFGGNFTSDLWQFDPGTNNWTWFKGPQAPSSSGHFGEQGVAHPDNMPSARHGCATWIDPDDNLWLFGGEGPDSTGAYGRLNDLWKFDPISRNWTWISGVSTRNAYGVYGSMGVADPVNYPGARRNSGTWTDDDGNFWLFGGNGRDDNTNPLSGMLNDLWRYDPETGIWTWVKGSSINNERGRYGTQGIPDPDNTPGARDRIATWTDAEGMLWLFGSYGFGITSYFGGLNDIWKYDPQAGNWTWMDGAKEIDDPGFFGELGVSAPENRPPTRIRAMFWSDPNGNFWLFGGSYRNDFWKYNVATGNWTWMGGAKTTELIPPEYGLMGMPADENNPGARRMAVSWTDLGGDLWLFGGTLYEFSYTGNLRNDLWRFSPHSGQWTWMKGSQENYAAGTYGEIGMPDAANNPSARMGAVSWTDQVGGLWLFGGRQSSYTFRNDLWQFDPNTENWVWMKGTPDQEQEGIYGPLGEEGSTYTPGARAEGVSWVDDTGDLWIFGGIHQKLIGYFPSGTPILETMVFDDLWRFNPDTGNWAWMHGTQSGGPGVYGEQGMPNPANMPGSRRRAVSWTDHSGNLWLFGGLGLGLPNEAGVLNDLWKYDTHSGQWTWMKGSGLDGQSGHYGTLGVPDPANTPGGRIEAYSWTDNDGNLWLFGGDFAPGDYETDLYNDLWKYDPSDGNWTWMGGASTKNAAGSLHSAAFPSTFNYPGARATGVSWTDPSGYFWLYSGYGFDVTGFPMILEDLWRGRIIHDNTASDWLMYP